MSSWVLWAFVAEIEIVIFIVWGIRHEDKLIAFERKAAQNFRAFVNAVKQTVTAKGAAK